MPLLKLWNRLFGNSQSTKSAKPNRGTGNGAGTSDGATRKLAKPTTPKQAASTSNENPARLIPAAAPAKRSVLDLVSGGPHASLCRMIKKSGAASILEVGVGDGTRAVAVLSTLAKSQPEREIKYFAIDLFEMGDGVLTLKTFHQQIRSIDIKPILIPMPGQQGLTRVAHTYGSVDLVLLAGEDVDTCDPLLGRVTHPASLIFRWDGQAWQQIQRKNLGQRGGREAA